MTPPVDVLQPEPALEKAEPASLAAAPPQPLHVTGLLDSLFEPDDLTPVIGRSYPTLQLRDVLRHDRSDELLRDLAIVISRRNELTPEEQKEFTSRLGQLSGKPRTSGLHVHPALNADREVNLDNGQRNRDNEISVIDSELFAKLGRRERPTADEWHSDIPFEKVPADYTSLKVHTLPPTGGDTLWASGDLLSPQFQSMADSLVGQFASPEFTAAAAHHGFKINQGPRGAAENVGEELSAEHPFVRTNPVTGWKSLFGGGFFLRSIKGLNPSESELIRRFSLGLLTQQHTAQVRYRWGKNDLAVWDNRSTFHAASFYYDGLSNRSGVRAVSCGERPYFDPNSRSRRAELGN